MVEWQPGTTRDVRRARDQLYRRIRAFFHDRDFIEVDPPLLGRGGSTDHHLHSLTTQVGTENLYLQTSPEFFMKRLLAAGSGPIFALAKSFRHGEQGRHHNLEFTILEWYQPGFDDHALMAQVADFTRVVLGQAAEKIAYRDCFMQVTGLNPHTAEMADLQTFAKNQLEIAWESDNRDTWLELIFSHCVQPTLAPATLIYDYPVGQAALAQTGNNQHAESIARRFELFCAGVELGNGYCELTDGKEQLRRFQADNARRQALGLETIAIDQQLVAALQAGLPPCAGIAIGVDRLLMLIMGASCLGTVIDFPWQRV